MDVYSLMARKLTELIETTTDGFTFDLPSDVDWHRPHVFVSNHRDIILDACLLEMVFYRSGLPQPAALAGTNLMTNPTMIKVCRANRVFCMPRGDGSKMAFYRCMQQTSQQIATLLDEGTSVWVAQRNGRTKDGLDKTDPAVLKMLCLCGDDKRQAMQRLGITPMSISYEWEPCDLLKARELMTKERDGEYHKQPHEDEQSILTGIRQPKGRIHLSIGHPLEVEALEGDLFESAALQIDEHIWSRYRLWPNNHIARAMLRGEREAGDTELWSENEWQAFEQHLNEGGAELRDWLLKIYAGKN